VAFGRVPTIPYGVFPGKLVMDHNAMLLDRNGILSLGRDLREAFENVERIEWAAKVTFFALLFGDIKGLSRSEINRLLDLHQKFIR
jgi:ribulose-5-phosphate 4-epimerase/fuculose-1-phosphate aldolase